MPQTIYLPEERSPFESLLPMVQQMFLMKFHHKMDMDVMEAETKQRAAEKTEKRGYQEKTQIAKEKRKEVRNIPKIYELDGEKFVATGSKLTRIEPTQTSVAKNYKAAVADKSWNPVRTKGEPMSGGIAHYKSYMAKASATPLKEKIALKRTPTETQEKNLAISKERLELSKQQKTVQMQGRAIEAEQQILGDPKDPRASTAVRQFQQNAGTQPYMYVSKERIGWFGGKTTEAEKIQLPVDPKTGRQVTAKDVMDTLKANPAKFRNVQEVLKAIRAM